MVSHRTVTIISALGAMGAVASALIAMSVKDRANSSWMEERGHTRSIEARATEFAARIESLEKRIDAAEQDTSIEVSDPRGDAIDGISERLRRAEMKLATALISSNSSISSTESRGGGHRDEERDDAMIERSSQGYEGILFDEKSSNTSRLAALRMLLRPPISIEIDAGVASVASSLMLGGEVKGKGLERLVENLGDTKSELLLPSYVRLYDSTSDPDLAVELVRALSHFIGDPDADDLIARALESSNSEVREAARAYGER